MKSNCQHCVDNACTHPKTQSPTCVLDDPRAHQCRLVYNDKRRQPVWKGPNSLAEHSTHGSHPPCQHGDVVGKVSPFDQLFVKVKNG